MHKSIKVTWLIGIGFSLLLAGLACTLPLFRRLPHRSRGRLRPAPLAELRLGLPAGQ